MQSVLALFRGGVGRYHDALRDMGVDRMSARRNVANSRKSAEAKCKENQIQKVDGRATSVETGSNVELVHPAPVRRKVSRDAETCNILQKCFITAVNIYFKNEEALNEYVSKAQLFERFTRIARGMVGKPLKRKDTETLLREAFAAAGHTQISSGMSSLIERLAHKAEIDSANIYHRDVDDRPAPLPIDFPPPTDDPRFALAGLPRWKYRKELAAYPEYFDKNVEDSLAGDRIDKLSAVDFFEVIWRRFADAGILFLDMMTSKHGGFDPELIAAIRVIYSRKGIPDGGDILPPRRVEHTNARLTDPSASPLELAYAVDAARRRIGTNHQKVQNNEVALSRSPGG